jgi:hypothetical protein
MHDALYLVSVIATCADKICRHRMYCKLQLDYLLEDVVERLRPLNWDMFWQKQKLQPLHIVASAVQSQRSVVLRSDSILVLRNHDC